MEEEGSDEAIKIRDEYINGDIKLIAPELINFEVLNALHYKGLFSEYILYSGVSIFMDVSKNSLLPIFLEENTL